MTSIVSIKMLNDRLLKSSMCVRFFVFVLALGVVEGQERLDPLVQTKIGLIRGLQATDGDYSKFLGIPYAKVDEENPFGPSTPHPKFDDIFNAFDDSAMCPQVGEFTNKITGTLDCLHLNVYVPNKASSKNKLPVLVWIHGGGFSSGNGGGYVQGPKFLVRHDVIVVSINYRLGAYGFMCLNTPEVPGNQGLKDQRLALRWIKANIAAFGGNENKITLVGESAGGTSVDLHLLSEHDTLFNQVIMQSGTALLSLVGESIENAHFILARELGFETVNDTEALSFLSQTDTNLIIAATKSSSLFFKVCFEKNFEHVESFITKHPLNVDRPKIKNTPILAGFNSNEMLMSYELKPSHEFKGFDIFSNALKGYFIYDDQFMDMVDIAQRFYIGDEDMSDALRWNLMEFESDITFNFPIQWTIDNYLEKGATKIYQYLFSYSGGRNILKNNMNLKGRGATHADEIGYLFDMSYVKDVPSEEDQRMIDQITTLWTNFVKYGEPTPETSELLPVKWIPITKNRNSFLNIDSALTLERLPYSKRLTFWKLFFKTNLQRLKLYQQENNM